MANILPSSPPPSGSRLPLARRAGIALGAVVVIFAGLGHVIGGRQAMIVAAVAGGVILLFFLVRSRRRSPGGLPPGLRGLPPGLRGGRMPGLGLPRGVGRLPRGLGSGGPLRLPRGVGRTRLPGGMRPPLPRGMRLPPAGRPRTGIPGASSRKGGAPGRSGSRAGARAGLPGGSPRFRPGAAGAPAFRSSARATARRGPASRSGSPGFGRAGSRSPGGLPGSRSASGRGSWWSPSRRGGIGSGSRPGSPAPARGWRRLIPRAMRPAARGTVPGSRWAPSSRNGPTGRRRSRRASFRSPRVKVRGGPRRWHRKAKGPQPVRTHRLRPFTGAWLIHHVGRYGRRRVRRKAARGPVGPTRRVFSRSPWYAWPGIAVPVLLGGPMARGWRRMQGFLIALASRKKNRTQAPSNPAGPTVTIIPPRSAADPYAHRRPRPARPRPGPAAPTGAPYAPSYSPTGGQHMPNVTSAPVEQVVEAIGSALGNFNPEQVVPDVEALLENHFKIYEALTANFKKIAGRIEDESPVNNDVADALREMVPALDGLVQQANEAYEVFKKRHAQELDQHYNPRPNEGAWNTR